MATANTYMASWSGTPTGANTILQIATGSTKPIEIYRVNVDQQNNTTTAAMGLTLNRVGGAVTWTSPTTVTARPLNPSDPTSIGATITANGTSVSDGTSPVVLMQDGFNVLAGYDYLPVPEERIIIAAASWFTIKFVVAPPGSTTFNIDVCFRELG